MRKFDDTTKLIAGIRDGFKEEEENIGTLYSGFVLKTVPSAWTDAAGTVSYLVSSATVAQSTQIYLNTGSNSLLNDLEGLTRLVDPQTISGTYQAPYYTQTTTAPVLLLNRAPFFVSSFDK